MRAAAALQLRPICRIGLRLDVGLSQAPASILCLRGSVARSYSSSAARPRPASPAWQVSAFRSVATLGWLRGDAVRIWLAKQRLAAKPDDVQAWRNLYTMLLANGTRDTMTIATVISDYEKKSAIFSDAPDATNVYLLDQGLFDQYLHALAFSSQGGVKVADASLKRAGILTSGNASAQAAPTRTASAEQATSTVAPGPLSAEEIAKHALSTEGLRVVSAQPRYTGQTAGGAGAGAEALKQTVDVRVEHVKDNFFVELLKSVMRFLVFTIVIILLFRYFIAPSLTGGSIMKSIREASSSQFKPPGGSAKTTFADVHGCDEAKDELREVVEFLKDPAKFSKLGGKPLRGVLLTGPPGTGKTLLARAVAGEAGVNFSVAAGSDFEEMFVGVGSRRVKDLFSEARRNAPAIIFIDELDAVGSTRNPRDPNHSRQTLNAILTEMDGFSQQAGIVVIAATNLPDSLDKALVRPGRFDRIVAVPLPDVRGRLAIIQHFLRKRKVPWDEKLVDLSVVARGTPGFSGAQLEALINQAAVRASVDGSAKVLPQHIEWARDRILLGNERKSAIVTPESRRRTAFHEAGHAIMALYTKGADPLHKITVVPRGHALGVTFQLPEMDKDSQTFAEAKARLDVCMGGRAAEDLIYGKENVTTGAASDIVQATQIANQMVRQCGFSDEIGPVALPEESSYLHSTETRAKVEKEVRTFIEDSQMRAKALLRARAAELHQLAEALIIHETLTGEEVKQLLQGKPLQKPTVEALKPTLDLPQPASA